jgi:hypothetical protein
LVTDELYKELIASGYPTLHVPIQSAVLISAFGQRTKRLKLQALLEFKQGEHNYEQMFVVSAQLMMPVIIGADFMIDHGMIVNFEDKCL